MSPDAGSLVARASTVEPAPSAQAGAATPLVGPVASARFAVVDVETSGLRPDRHRLLQIGVVRVLGDGTVVDRWDTLLKAPWRPLGGRRVHGLSRRVLRGAPRLRAVRAELVHLLDGSILCGHNVEFDWSFLVRGFRRAGYPAPDALRLCTLHLSRALDPERERSHRLGDLCARYGVELARAHDAAADAAATAAILPRLLTAAGIGDVADLAPHLAGSTLRWPVPARR
jgi:DNA polymerase III subunit epsilon